VANTKIGESIVTVKQRSLWFNRNFLFIWIGKMISNFGSQIYTIALPLLIYDLSHSALAMSTMRAIDFFPNIFIGMIAGVMVDRFSRKWIMSIMTLLQIGALSGMVVLLFAEQIEVWHLYILGFILTSSGYTFGNAQHSIIPQLVMKEQLTEANAKLTFLDTLIRTIGPGIAGLIIAIYSYQTSFTLYLICLIVLILLLQGIEEPKSERTPSKQKTVWGDMKEGITALIENKTLLTPTVIIIFKNLAASLVLGVLIFYAADVLLASEKEIGLMYSIGAVGGLLASITVSWIRKRLGRGNIFVWSILIDVIGMIVLIFSHTWWIIGVSLFIRMYSVTVSNIAYLTIRQEFTPNHLLGRVAGTSSMLMKLSTPIGFFLSGIWAEFLPVRWLFVFSAIILFIMFIVALKSRFAEVE
jgi:MFS family permease